MAKDSYTKNDLIEILIKKASGFYYSEEQFEYEKTQNKSQINKIQAQNISFFENNDRGQNEIITLNDTIELSNETNISKQNNQELTLVKKKVATHYVSPDINAIKILFEILENKVGEDSFNDIDNEELLLIKKKLVEELSDELNKN